MDMLLQAWKPVWRFIIIVCIWCVCGPTRAMAGYWAQSAMLWSWLSPPVFIWVLGIQLRPEPVHHKHFSHWPWKTGFKIIFICGVQSYFYQEKLSKMFPVSYWGLEMCLSNRVLAYTHIALNLICSVAKCSKGIPQQQTTPNSQGVAQSRWFSGYVNEESEIIFQYVKNFYLS